MPRRRSERTSPVSAEVSRERRVPSADDVARRAYQLYEARGGEPGRDIEDWLQAERELEAILLADVSERRAAAPEPVTAPDEAASSDAPRQRPGSSHITLVGAAE
jgi:hypothetical protein